MARGALLVAGLVALVAATGCSDKDPSKHMQAAQDASQKGDVNTAAIELKNALQMDPELAQARFMLGTILLKERDPVAAEVEFRKAMAADHPSVVVVPELAKAMLMNGQGWRVVEEFNSVSLDSPQADASLQVSLAQAYSVMDKPAQARKALDAALAMAPDYAPVLLLKARQMAAAKDMAGALQVTEQVIGKDPKNAEARKLKGDLLAVSGAGDEVVISAYRAAIQADPRFAPAHAALFAIFLREGALDAAAKSLEQVKLSAPNARHTKLLTAQLAYATQDFRAARELSRQLVKGSPNDPETLQLAGAVEYQLKALGQAETFLATAVRVRPELAVARRLLILTYLRSAQPAKALETLTSGAGTGGIGPELFSVAGEVYLRNGDAKKAEEHFAKALKLDPANPDKRTALAVSRLSDGQTSSALAELQRIAESDPGTAADHALVNAYLRSKEFDKALAAVDRLQAKQPASAEGAHLRGRVQLARNDSASARASFERALAIDPGFFVSAASLATLDVSDGKTDAARKRFEDLLLASPKHPQALLALANLAIANGAGKDEVSRLLAGATEANPADLAPRLLWINYLLSTNYAKQAVVVAQRAIAAVPNNDRLYEALGRAHQLAGDLNQAIVAYSKAASLQPLSPVGHLQLAQAYIATKNMSEAKQSLWRALQLKPESLEAQRGLVFLALGAKEYPQAMKIARTVQSQRPASPVGLALEGDILSAQGQWEAAQTAYRAGLQRGASTHLATRLHMTMSAAGNASQAARFARSWVDEHPLDLDFLSYLAQTAVSVKDYPEALRMARTLQSKSPTSPAGLALEGDVQSALGKWDAAAVAYRGGLQRAPSTALAARLHAVLSAAGKATEADQFAATWMKEHPTDAGFQNHLGDMALAKPDLEEAQWHFLAAVKIDPSSAMALNNLAWTLGLLKRDGAISRAQKAVELAPDQPTYRDTLAMLLLANGDYAKAIETQTAAVAMQPTNATLRLNLAKVFIAAGEKERAKGELEKLMALGASNPSYKPASALLSSLSRAPAR